MLVFKRVSFIVYNPFHDGICELEKRTLGNTAEPVGRSQKKYYIRKALLIL